MNRLKSLLLHSLCTALLALTTATLAQADEALTAVETLPPATTVSARTRCPVCGMYPARYPKWMVQLIYRDQTQKVFDSPADLLRFLQHMDKYDRTHTATDIAAIYLSDYQKGGWINAKTSYLVMGSKARGPMNQPDLPAFPSRERAEQFAQSSGGHVHAYSELNAEILDAMQPGQDMLHGASHGDHSHHHH